MLVHESQGQVGGTGKGKGKGKGKRAPRPYPPSRDSATPKG